MPDTGKDITIDDVKSILGRAMIDGDFRSKLVNDPESVIEILGFKQSQTSADFFKALRNDSFLAVAQTVEDRLGGRPVIALWL